MALTQVRVQFQGTWTVLAYNPATGRYEGTITPSGTSYHQPGGWFPLTAEVTNDSGRTESITGATLTSLRLVVREVNSPTLTLVSPPAGYLTTASPAFVLAAADEAGGSGVNPGSVKAYIDGAEIACTATETAGGYQITFQAQGLAEGSHAVTVSIADNDGNVSTVSAAYFVDTIPPELRMIKPLYRHIVDAPLQEVTVEASDGGSGLAAVSIGGQTAQGTGGRFTAAVPLAVGENFIALSATDAAGNQATATLYMIRLVTDRTAADVAKLQEMYARGESRWTAEEKAWFETGVLKGAYTTDDYNRVEKAVAHLSEELAAFGYYAPVTLKTWAETDAATVSAAKTYLNNVRIVTEAQPFEPPSVPGNMRFINTQNANQIEKALLEVEKPLDRYRWWTSGELTAGE